jgi:hypothetical protein
LTVFGIAMATYCFGLLLFLLRSDHAKTVNQRLSGGGGIDLVAAFFTDVIVEDSLFESSANGYHLSGWPPAITNASLIGSLLLGLAFLLMLIKPRAKLPGLVGACLAWPYFGYLAWSLPWRDFIWLVKIHWDGEFQVIAIFSLVVATAYSILGWVARPKAVG